MLIKFPKFVQIVTLSDANSFLYYQTRIHSLALQGLKVVVGFIKTLFVFIIH